MASHRLGGVLVTQQKKHKNTSTMVSGGKPCYYYHKTLTNNMNSMASNLIFQQFRVMTNGGHLFTKTLSDSSEAF
eukprot:scaffold7354_cov207-Skeletonema_marinoi.AAC.2